MKLRIARKIAKIALAGPIRVSVGGAHNPEQHRRAALRLHRNWWRRGNGSWRDRMQAFAMASRERRRRLYHRRRAGMPWRPRSSGFWPEHPWPPDGNREAIARRGVPWVAVWRAALADLEHRRKT